MKINYIRMIMPKYDKYYGFVCNSMPSNRLFCYFGCIKTCHK